MARLPTNTASQLVANPRMAGTILLAVVSLLIFLPVIPVSLFAAFAFAVDPSTTAGVPLWQVLLTVAALLLTAVAGFAFVTMAAVAVWDLRLPRPVIRVDSAGVLDRRLGSDPIPWSNIERVFMKAAQNSGIELHLRSPQPKPLNRFRLGGLMAWRRKDDRIAYLALNDVTGPAINREAMAQLAVENGAEAVMHYNKDWTDVRRPFPKP